MATDHQLHKKLYNDCFTIKEIHQLQFSLDLQKLKQKLPHVGIPFVSDMKSDSAIEVAVRKGRAAFHSEWVSVLEIKYHLARLQALNSINL